MLETVNKLSSVFNLKVQDGMKDFLGCEIEIISEKGWIKQSRIVDKLEKDWKDKIKRKDSNVPVGEGYKVIRPSENEKMMDDAEPKSYRSGVGTLMYLVKLS